MFILAAVPVDFEEIVVKQAESTEATCYEALTAIQRNGVALKGITYLYMFNFLKLFCNDRIVHIKTKFKMLLCISTLYISFDIINCTTK